MPTEVIEIKAVGKDEVTAELKRVQRSLKGIETELKNTEQKAKGLKGAFGKLSDGTKKLGVGIGRLNAFVAGSMAADFTKQVFEMGKVGATTADQFAILSRRIEGLPLLMSDIKTATKGMIPDDVLLKSIATFDAFDLPLKEMPTALAEVAKTAMRTGESAEHLAASLATGVARMSGPILDNLGIQVKMADVTLHASKMFGVQADHLTDLQKKTALMNMALDDLATKNADIKLNEMRTTGFLQLETAIKDSTQTLSEYVATVIDSYKYVLPSTSNQEALAEALEDVARKSASVNKQVDRLGNALTGPLGGAPVDFAIGMAKLSESVRDAAVALRQIPVDERKAAFDRLLQSIDGIPIGLQRKIAKLGEVDSALRNTASVARATAITMDDVYRMAGLGAPMLLPGDPGYTPPKQPRKRRGGGGGGGGRQAAQKEFAKLERDAALAAVEHNKAKLIELETTHKLADLAKLRDRLLDKGLDRSRVMNAIAALELQLVNQETEQLIKIDAQTAEIAALEGERIKALKLLHQEHLLEVELSKIELDLIRTADPLKQAQLQLERERLLIMHELRQINEDDADATVQRTKAQNDLNAAMERYAVTVESIKHEQLMSGLAAASAIASSAAGQLNELHEGMAAALGVAGKSVEAITNQYDLYSQSQTDVASAVTAATGGIGQAVAGQIEDERTRAGVLAAIEAAMSVAAFARLDIPAGIAHAAAASMFTAVAAGAGGGGGGASGGGGGGAAAAGAEAERERDQQGGFGEGSGRQVIVQFGSGVVLGSAQQVAKAIQQADHSARGTGHAAGY